LVKGKHDALDVNQLVEGPLGDAERQSKR
jgi:hypothetical protein